MNATDLIVYANANAIDLKVDGDQLKINSLKGAINAEMLAHFKRSKFDIITLLSENDAGNNVRTAIKHHAFDMVFPASFAQRGLWFINQIDPSNVVYNEISALRFIGVLDKEFLQRALNKIVERHASLRTTFSDGADGPHQIIAPSLQLSLPIADLRSLPVSPASEEMRLIAAQAEQPFDLARGPLIRALLIRSGDAEHILVLTLHHIVCDGWSTGIFLHELSAMYHAFANGHTSPLPELPTQYTDFSAWQRRQLTSVKLERQLAYWKAQLTDAPEFLALPIDHPRPAIETHRGAQYRFMLPSRLSAALHALSKENSVTMFMLMSAVFNALLCRYTGQSDLCIGTPIVNRSKKEFETLIGCFVNMLTLRNRFSAEWQFDRLLAHVRDTAVAAYQHQDAPFERVVDAVNLQGRLDRAGLFQTVLQWHNAQSVDLAELPFGAVTAVEQIPIQNRTAKFDLMLELQNSSAGIEGRFTYATDLFEASTIERMATHFMILAEGIVNNPRLRICDLPILSPAENQKLFVWNDNKTAYCNDLTIHQLFEEQAARMPDNIALVFEDQEITYAQLNTSANQLAHRLRGLDVGPDALVGLYVERSIEMIVGILGVLKAGAAYLPLDPTYPQERLAYIVNDARLRVLLTQTQLVNRLPATAIPRLCLDSAEAFAQQLASNPQNKTHSTHLAYVIYTSGSTGKPKGVQVGHQGAINLLSSTHDINRLSESDRVVQKTTFSFDVSVWEIFWPLVKGAALVIARPDGHQDVWYLAKLIDRHGVTTLHCTPSMLDAFLDEANGENCRTLKRVVCAGEALSPHLERRFFNQLPQVQLQNRYGPTEASIYASFWNCKFESNVRSIPIGKPFGNIRIYVLDEYLNRVPIGVAGELYISGDGLARGYLSRPDLTAEKFIADPFGLPGSRMYKSGDLARYLPDGDIEYLGRIDHQVKIRGFRIEIGEIEAALTVLPSVGDAVVLARDDLNGGTCLVAYLVNADDKIDINTDTLRSTLSQSLPDYMVPAHFVILEQLPLTVNGKVNRKALPIPDMTRSEMTYSEPRSQTEKALATIWADVLKLEKVSVHDHFFHIGGHSLLATSAISRIRTALKIDIPLRTLFEAPTVAQFAQQIEAKQHEVNSFLPIVSIARNKPLRLSFAQRRLWFLDQLTPASALYNMPVALRLTGALDIAILQNAFNNVITRHDALRTTFSTLDGEPVQIVAPRLAVPLPLTDLGDLPHAEREAKTLWLAQDDAQTPFNLATGPLLRARLLRLQESEHFLLVNVHHIVSDGWSIDVMLKEVAALYKAFLHHQMSPLPLLAVQYADFAHWQCEWLSGDILQQQLDYWMTQLQNAPTLLALPTDRSRPAVQRYRGARVDFLLPQSMAGALQTLCQRTNTTLFMVLATAFSVLLSRYSNQTDICIGTPIANRNRKELETLIGFFVNTLVLRMQVDPHQSFQDLLTQVQETAMQAYAHQDLPFERLVEALLLERQLSHSPLFQAMFVLQDVDLSAVQMPGLTLEHVSLPSSVAKFDLTLTITTSPQGLRGGFEYDIDLFDAATIARMVLHFVQLLRGILAEPAATVGDLPLLADDERRQLLVDWNDSATVYPDEYTIHQLFEAQAARMPNHIALIFEQEQISYAELNARANRLAHHLRELGVGPDTVVALHVERSIEMIVGMLGILKAGGAYLPLDPTYPQDRLIYILEDAKPCVMLSQAHLPPLLTSYGLPCIWLDAEFHLHGESVANPQCLTLPQHLAYVIYTSGSTGKPKGSLLHHRGLCNLICAQLVDFSIHQDDRILQFASFNFDASVSEIFMALVRGASLVLTSRDRLLPGGGLEAVLQEQEITVVTLPPSILNMLSADTFPKLRTLISAGEPCSQSVADAWIPGHAFFNAYGPTEATVCASIHACVVSRSRHAPIGTPIANTQIYILDKRLHPVPVGVAGELHIAGVGLARGYQNRPDLTADRYIPNPFGDGGGRMYKSGDLARYLPSGEIELLGRIDHQVNLRGLRIELGEIEAALLALPKIHNAIVLAREDIPGDKRLTAYVVANVATSGDAIVAWRTALSVSLPHYMVPAHFVVLDRFPLTPNGKIDRNALPAPSMQREMTNDYSAPRTRTEILMAQIWAEVLRMDRIGIDDNVFTLGAHSLLMVKVVHQLQEKLGRSVPLQLLFKHATIRSLATALGHAESANERSLDERIYIEGDSTLDLTITPTDCLPTPLGSARAIFLTGATGYVGSYLLMEFLTNTAADIYCLVRAQDREAAFARLEQAVYKHGFDGLHAFATRVKPVLGCLEKSLFGLPRHAFDQLALAIDAVIHSAASINLMLPYHMLKPANVDGTREIIRFAATAKMKPLHYMSTLSVFSAKYYYDGRTILESEDPQQAPEEGGYAQSKWVAERLVKQAAQLGLPVSIYRLGSVVGAKRSGIWRADDMAYQVLHAAFSSGTWLDVDMPMPWVPVDFVAQAVLAIGDDVGSNGRTVHLVGRKPIRRDTIYKWACDAGIALTKISTTAWRDSLTVEDTATASLPLLFGASLSADISSLRSPLFDCSNTAAVLRRYGLDTVEIDRELVVKLICTPGNFPLKKCS